MNCFYTVAYEMGAERTAVATWASKRENPLDLDSDYAAPLRRNDLDELPGGFQLSGLLSAEECRQFIEATEQLCYSQDASVSLPRSVRHNENLVWVVDDTTHDIIWKRCQSLMHDHASIYNGKRPLGLNKRFRFYKYSEGDFFKPHTDGAWPGSAVIDKKLVTNAYPDRYSQMSFLILLSDDFRGGETAFFVDKEDPSKPAKRQDHATLVNVRTPLGGVLCFPHGTHPLHCLHSSAEILSGTKYIIRTDVLFER